MELVKVTLDQEDLDLIVDSLEYHKLGCMEADGCDGYPAGTNVAYIGKLESLQERINTNVKI